MKLQLSRSVREAYVSDLGEVRAFLPDRVPGAQLPEPLQIYLQACADLPHHYPAQQGGVRSWLDNLFHQSSPEVEETLVQLTPSEGWTLLAALVILGHTYRWDTLPAKPERFVEATVALPTGLGGPWTTLAERFGQPRVGTMWSFHLCNWRLLDRPGGSAYNPAELTLDNLRLAHQWLEPPTSRDLERFSLSFVLMEARGAKVVRAIVDAIAAAAREDVQEASFRLDVLQDAIYDMAKVFILIIREALVDPQKWLELIQPTSAWAADGLPGPNGLQLPTLQCIDVALDVPATSSLAQQAVAARDYMPEPQRHFLTVLDQARGVIRSFVEASDSLILQRHYNDCLRAMRKFRIAHRVRGVHYLTAGRHGSSGRVSTGLGIAWRPPAGTSEPAESSAAAGGANAAEPIREFEHQMNERIAETEAALLVSDQRGEDPTVESTFRFLTAADRSLLIENAPRKTFRNNEPIIRQGDRRQALYVIREGFVRIEAQGKGTRVVLAHLWPGEVFGEASFLTNAEATASVIADEEVELHVLDRSHVYAILGQSPELAARFYQSLAVELAHRLRDTDALVVALTRNGTGGLV